MEAAATARDLQYLRHAIARSAASKARGKHPFAALIVDDRDEVLAETVSEARLRTLTGDHPANPTLALPCREVFARGQRAIVVVGPLLEDEAAAPHLGFWR